MNGVDGTNNGDDESQLGDVVSLGTQRFERGLIPHYLPDPGYFDFTGNEPIIKHGAVTLNSLPINNNPKARQNLDSVIDILQQTGYNIGEMQFDLIQEGDYISMYIMTQAGEPRAIFNNFMSNSGEVIFFGNERSRNWEREFRDFLQTAGSDVHNLAFADSRDNGKNISFGIRKEDGTLELRNYEIPTTGSVISLTNRTAGSANKALGTTKKGGRNEKDEVS